VTCTEPYAGYINRLAIVLFFATCLITNSSDAEADEIAVSRFSNEGLANWETRSFKGITEYRLLKENGVTVLKATSKASASGLLKKIRFDPKIYRYLRWSWKISHTIKGGDEMTRGGDDYAARVYVVFPGKFFWQIRAINYIWANKLTKGEHVSNPYASDAKMFAVESGNGMADKWVSEERSLFDDYRLLFGVDPPEAEAVAIMTDTDNTGETADAWYGEISLSTVGK